MSFESAAAQNLLSTPEAVVSDSLTADLSFEIQYLQLELILPKLESTADFAEIIELKLFAEEAAKEKDFSLALIYLDEIFAIAQENKIEVQGLITALILQSIRPKSETTFSKALLLGMDFSQQQYHLTFDIQDSSFVETFNNPFGGVRFVWNRYQLNRYDLTLGGMFKYSRDYTLWQLESRFEKSNLLGLNLQFAQQGEGMDYKRVFPIHYQQSLTDLRLEKKISRHFTLEFDDEFQYRNYPNESETFATYWRHETQLQARITDFCNSRFVLGFDLDQRWQKTYSLYDYRDNRISLQHYFNPTWRTSFSSWYQYRQMSYPQGAVDSSYFADYDQHSLTLNGKQNIQERIAIRLYAEGYLRNYLGNTTYTADYQYLHLEPGLRFELSDKLTLGVNYLLELKRFKKNPAQSSGWSLNEDQFAEGISLALDYFNFKNIMFSFNHTFRLNSYPNALNSDIPGFSLYTDRLVNSTMLYLSYKMFSALELTLILQHDLDRDREIPNNDSRSSIFSFDVAWKW